MRNIDGSLFREKYVEIFSHKRENSCFYSKMDEADSLDEKENGQHIRAGRWFASLYSKPG